MQSMTTFGMYLNGKFLRLLCIPQSLSEHGAGLARGRSLLDNGNLYYKTLQIIFGMIFFWPTSCSYSRQINQNMIDFSPYPTARAKYRNYRGCQQR